MKTSILTLLVLLISFGLRAQVAINTDNSNPDPSAMLDVKSIDKGILVPRLTTSQRTNILSPANGLLVFDSETGSFWYYDNSQWIELKDESNNHTLVDTDGDTQIQVEKNPNEDIIHFDMAGTEYFRMDSGRIEVLNTGNSVFIGENAGANDDMTNNKNVALGAFTFYSNISGEYNTAIGNSALYDNTTGEYNVATGVNALFNNTNGNFNSANGNAALVSNNDGERNSGFGYAALYSNTSGNQNTCLGAFSDVSYGNLTNATAIGYGAKVNLSNSLILGNNANVGIGTGSPSYKLHVSGGEGSVSMMLEADTDNSSETDHPQLIFSQDGGAVISRIGMFEGSNDFSIRQEYNSDIQFFTNTNLVLRLSAAGNLVLYTGNAYKPGGGSWAATSDGRLKKNIKPYQDGLSSLLQINPVTYNYNEKSGFNTHKEYVGVIAQELQEIAPYMMAGTCEKDGEEYLQIDNSAITYMLINAVKELHEENKQLKEDIAQIKSLLEIQAQK